MNSETRRSAIPARRTELLAELFFQELDPIFVSRPTEEVGYDLLVGFRNKKGGVNTVAVEVKGTEQPLPHSRFQLARSVYDRMVHSNVPGLLIVADVKRNRLYYAWLASKPSHFGNTTVSIPVTEVNEQTRAQLRAQLTAAESFATHGRFAEP